MERGGDLKRYAPIKSKKKLQVKGHSDTAVIKDEIQAVVREIVIARDGGCVLRDVYFADGPECGGYRKDGELILQADHLVTRANAATFADTRLVVCVCKVHHGWKSVGSNARKKLYDEILRSILPPERVALWDRCEAESWRANRGAAYNWAVTLAALKQERDRVPADH